MSSYTCALDNMIADPASVQEAVRGLLRRWDDMFTPFLEHQLQALQTHTGFTTVRPDHKSDHMITSDHMYKTNNIQNLHA